MDRAEETHHEANRAPEGHPACDEAHKCPVRVVEIATAPIMSGRVKLFHTKVVDIAVRNPDGSSRQEIISRCSIREPLTLEREPDNPQDIFAVTVCRTNGDQLGFLPPDRAAEIASVMDGGGSVYAEISGLTGGWLLKRTRGAKIIIVPFIDRPMQHDPAAAVMRYLKEAFPEAQIQDATSHPNLIASFRVEERGGGHLLFISLEVLEGKTEDEISELLRKQDIAERLREAGNDPVLLRNEGPQLMW